MLGALTNDIDWCKMLRSNDLAVLWQHYLSTDKIPATMKKAYSTRFVTSSRICRC